MQLILVFSLQCDDTYFCFEQSRLTVLVNFVSRAQYYLHMAPDATHDDDMRTSPEVIDSSENEDVVEVSEHVNSHVPHSPKPNLSVSGSMHKLLECPVCLNAMYPPIHQVFSCFGQYFCVHFEAFQLGMALGGDNESKCYSYSLEVGGYRRKITRQGVP
ncbi:hypothetical protein MUK42_12992 [Musa troglodytarum]|uniref:Seven-in-absentia protein TRAF-like domain-containing protein n=1 Tax=Musa troglodytarum TaxID=320322 RepID=A0A9E7KSC1_9LILI|nr:hypothetical protein MUK42_12992 [Musa troglodytarum]